MIHNMRTTLDLDDDILSLAKQLARQRRTTAGRVISELARLALTPKAAPRARNGVPLFPLRPHARKAHLDLVNKLRDDER